MKKGIAFFDFDGTITTKDTLLEFIKFSKGRFRFYLGFFLNLHYLIAFKLKIITNQAAKEKVLQFFFNGITSDEFEEQCRLFSREVLPGLIRPGALEEIRKHKQNNYLVVVVSASPENWIREWAHSIQVDLIASQLEVKNGRLTGKILGKNCHGKEKVRRIMEKHVISEYADVCAYGDSKGDLPMLELATNQHYKPFRR